MKFTAEQIAEAKKCSTPEEVVEKAKANGLDVSLDKAKALLSARKTMLLDDESLSAVTGGSKSGCADAAATLPCKSCDGTSDLIEAGDTIDKYRCRKCGKVDFYSCGMFLYTEGGYDSGENP